MEMRKLGEVLFYICTGELVEQRSLDDQVQKYLSNDKDKLKDKLIYQNQEV